MTNYTLKVLPVLTGPAEAGLARVGAVGVVVGVEPAVIVPLATSAPSGLDN